MRASLIALAALFALAPRAEAAKLYVANNGVDSPTCGARETPCRSITQGIANAAAGDTMIVDPGKYGDLNGNGGLGETGEETPPDPCSCMLLVNKPVTLVSSDGAAVTNIDATPVINLDFNIRITASGVQFGAPGQGFTVTNARAQSPSDPDSSSGLEVVDADDVRIRGNRFLRVQTPSSFGIGFGVGADESQVRIEGNEVIGWGIGIEAGANTIVTQNAVHAGFGTVAATTGIFGAGVITGNIVTDYKTGIFPTGGALVLGNAVSGNNTGIAVFSEDATVEGNNIFGNGCGLSANVANLLADNNFWGTATGPGADPADDVCGTQAGTAVVTPFATKPLTIKLTISP